MRYLLFFGIAMLLQSCGTNQFAKRKYTKGVYVEKHSHGLTKPEKRGKRKLAKSQKGSTIVNVIDPKEEVLNEERKETNDEPIIEENAYVKIKPNEEDLSDSKPIFIEDDEVLKKEDRSRKPIIFGAISTAVATLGFGLVLIDFFILEIGFLALFSIPVIAGSAVISILGIIFSAIELRKGGNPIAKIGLILSVSTFLLIIATILLLVLIGF